MQSGNDTNKDYEYLEIEDPDFQAAVNQGVMDDHLSMRTIAFWSVATTLVIVILIAIAFNLYNFYKFEREFDKAIQTEYRELNTHREQAVSQLNQLEPIDEAAGIYRIPIDSAKTLTVDRYN